MSATHGAVPVGDQGALVIEVSGPSRLSPGKPALHDNINAVHPEISAAASAASSGASAQAVMTVTPAAASRIKDLMNKKRDDSIIGLRVGVGKKGCENMSYTMNYARDIGKLDEVVETEGVKVVVDPNALMYLIGTQMDYVDNDLASEFVFTNPNQKSSCGCECGELWFMAKEQTDSEGSAPKAAVPGLNGTFYMAYPIFSMCSDEHGLVLTGGGGGGKEYGVLDYIQAHVYDESTESFTTVSSIETDTKVCYDITYCPATDHFAAALTSECLLLRFDPVSLSLTCEERFTVELSNPGQTVCNVLRYSPSGAELLTGGDDGVVRVWNLASSTSAPRLALDDHHKEIVDAEWAPSGDRFVTCGRDRSVKLWSGEGACTDTIIPEKMKAISPLAKFARFVNDTYLIVATHGPRGPSWLTVYDVGSDGKAKEVKKSQISKAVICSIALSQDRSRAAIGFVDSTRMILSLTPISVLHKNTAVVHEMPPGKAAFVLNKHVVCTSSADYSVNIWNVKKPARSQGLGCCWWLIFLLSLVTLLYYGYLYALKEGHLGGQGRLDEL